MSLALNVCMDSNDCSKGCCTCLEVCASAVGSIPYIFCSLDPCFCCDQSPKKGYTTVNKTSKPPLIKEMSRVEIQF